MFSVGERRELQAEARHFYLQSQLLQQARDSHGVAQEITSGLLRRSAIRREPRSSTHQVASKVPA